MGNKRELRISSNLEEIYKVEQFVEEISDNYHLNESYFGNIIISVTEAVRNAIIHGNLSDNAKNVHVLAESRPEGLHFSIIDEGRGFSFKDYESLDELLKDDSNEGRGLILIHTLADEIRFTNQGRTLNMLFKITGIDNDIYEKRYHQMQKYLKKRKEIPSDLSN